MDGRRFDQMARTLSGQSRRGVIGGLVGTLGLATLAEPSVEARKKKKKKKAKVVFNQHGCVDVGKECGGNNANCCSGLCQIVPGKKRKKGKKGKKRKSTSVCVAHNVSTCPASYDTCTKPSIACGSQGGQCFKTTGNGAFCGNNETANGECRDCKRDADCVAEFGPGAACVVCVGSCVATQGRACFAPAS